MITDYLVLALNSIRHRQLRSWLTVIGIIIGVASIIALISISNGLKFAIEEQFSKIGTQRLFIFPKGAQTGTTTSLTKDDVSTLESMSEFEYITPYLTSFSTKFESSNKVRYTYLIGMPTENSDKRFEDYDFGLQQGRFFRGGDKGVAVIGYLAAKDLFDKQIRIRNKIKIEDKPFTVIGIFDEIGNSQDDNQIYIPIDDAREILNKPTEVNMIDAQVKQGIDIEKVREKTIRVLEKARDDENFEIMSPTQLLKTLQDILGIVQLILISITAISLIVGAIGIMNSMYTSVLERTREIGIMKAIGATNLNILLIFLIESGLIGLVGGIFGVTFGILISQTVSLIAKQAGFGLLKIKIEPWLMLFGLLFAFIVGMISGFLPARQASKLKPVDALNY